MKAYFSTSKLRAGLRGITVRASNSYFDYIRLVYKLTELPTSSTKQSSGHADPLAKTVKIQSDLLATASKRVMA